MGDPAAPPDAAEELPPSSEEPLDDRTERPACGCNCIEKGPCTHCKPLANRADNVAGKLVGLAHTEHCQSNKRYQRGRHSSKHQVDADA